jgi:HEAT repeat protein
MSPAFTVHFSLIGFSLLLAAACTWPARAQESPPDPGTAVPSESSVETSGGGVTAADGSAGFPLARLMVRSEDELTRQKGYEILASASHKDSRRILLTGLEDDHAEVRAAAARSLLHYGIETVREDLIDYILSRDSALTEAFGESVALMRGALEVPMASLLADDEETVDRQAAAAYCLGRMGGTASTPLLAKRCWVRDPLLAVTAVQALVASGDSGALVHYRNLLRHPLRDVRLEALGGLAAAGGDDTVAILYDMAIGRLEPDIAMRRHAVHALGEIRRPSSVHALMGIMFENGTLREDVSAALRNLTGMEWHDPGSWRFWYDEWSANPVWPPTVGSTMRPEVELGEF